VGTVEAHVNIFPRWYIVLAIVTVAVALVVLLGAVR
jgi:hypothetical protein